MSEIERTKTNADTPDNCLVCREEIRPDALKCVHCDSFQDWRRHVNLSNTVLALLVALVSVSTVLLPILNELFEEQVSNVSVTYHGVHENLINLVATNSVSKEGVIAEEILALHSATSEPAIFKLEPRFDQIIVYGGATMQSTTRLNFLDFPRYIEWLRTHELDHAILSVRVENYGAKEWQKTFEVENADVQRIRTFAEGHQMRFGVP